MLSPPLALVAFDLDNSPALERKTEPAKKKEKVAKPAPAEVTEAAAPVKAAQASTPAPAEEKSTKKDKKEKKAAATGEDSGKKKGNAGGGKAPAAAEDAGDPVPSMIDLRVGRIVDSKWIFTLFLIVAFNRKGISQETPRCRLPLR